MTLAASALTTLANIKDELSITDSSQDTRLERYVTAASALIASFLGRPLHYDGAIVEKQEGYGDVFLELKRPPVWSVASILFDTAAVDATDYEIHDAGAGILYALRGWRWTTHRNHGAAQEPAPGYERRLYTVTYAGGWQCPAQNVVSGVDALPTEIEQACLMFATSLYASRGVDPNVASESLMSYSVSYGRPDAATAAGNMGLPTPVAAMLAPYRFLVQA